MKKYSSLWKKIQNILDKKGWSLKRLSEESGIKFSTLNHYKYENVNPTFEKVCQIADTLNINLDDLRESNTREWSPLSG